ncbi:MAG: SUMF1/EgtB/PvdO family nonheme iron enzyme [Treponema sp.]|jgi:formylglycine-generating enzyme required for sulfatase activity|nr:SUMF1/EgtB/PvdO family nonheme iron enzyme [Treponema sp.]
MKKKQIFALCALVILVLTACENPFIPQKYKEPAPPQAPSINIEASPIGPYVKGDGVTMTAKASVSDGGDLSYQWYSNTKNSNSGGKAVSGGTGESYSPSTNIEDLYDTTYYYVQVTNTLNGKTTAASSRTVDITVFDTEGRTPIREVALNVTPPVKDGIPAALEGVTSTGSGYTIQSVTWNPPHNTFQSGGKYTIWVMLTANEDYTFIAMRTATVNGQAAAVDSNQGSALYLAYEFKQVDVRVVTGIAIKTQPNEMTYDHEDTLRLQGLVVTLSYDSGDPEDIAFANFASRIITTNPAHGITLSHTTHNNTPIAVSCNGHTANTDNLTVNKMQITTAFVGIEPPAKENIPVTVATVASSDGFTAGPVTWNPSHNPFQGNINYTATVTLTAKADYEFASGMTAHINSSAAHITSNPNGTKTISYEFDKTLSGTVLGIAVTHQPTKLSYTHGEALDLSGLVVTVTVENSADEIITFSNASLFQTVPAHGSGLSHAAFDGQPITVNYSGHNAHTTALTVNKKALTLNTSAASHTKVYDGNMTANNIGGISLVGIAIFVPPDNVYIEQVNGVYTNADAGTKTVNITNVVINGGASGNYTVTLPVNNVTLTGTGNVGITPADPTVLTWPTAAEITIYTGFTLSASTLSGGSARGVNNENVPGTFAWANPTTTSSVGVHFYPVTFTPASGNYRTVTNNVSVSIKSPMELIQVEGGSFSMGRTNYVQTLSEVHSVRLGGNFSIGKYEVTQEQFNSVMGRNPSTFQGASYPPASGEVQNKRPVEFLTWFDAVEFCNKLTELENGSSANNVYTITDITRVTNNNNNYIQSATVTANWSKSGYRLPTEAEWEYAAKGGPLIDANSHNIWAGAAYTNSGIYVDSQLNNAMWFSYNADDKTHQVGKKTANGLGLYDMSGNVAEMCWDWYVLNYDGVGNGSVNPTGPTSGSTRVVRGGSFQSNLLNTRTTARANENLGLGGRRSNTGFRVARRP